MVEGFIKHLEYKDRSPRTIKIYRTALFEAFKALPLLKTDPAKVTPAMIQAWVVETKSPSTAAIRLSSLSSYFKFLVRAGKAPGNPVDAVDRPSKRRKRLPKPIDQDDARKMLTVQCGSRRSLQQKLIACILYTAGLRRAELAGLKRDAIDLEACTLRVIGKGNKERMAMFAPELVPEIKHWIELTKPKIYLLETITGHPITTSQIYKQLSRFTIRILGYTVHPHALRHSFVTHFLDNGGELREAQRLVGHASPSTTAIYDHVSQTRLADQYSQHRPGGTQSTI